MTLEEWEQQATRGTRGDMVWDMIRDWKKDRDLMMRGYEAMKGAEVLGRCYFEAQQRDPCNNTNYCRIADWVRDVEIVLELKEPRVANVEADAREECRP